jgi:nicotinate-nucleotide pyrophosphorylase (carboxylating)
MELLMEQIDEAINRALAEDLSAGDATTEALIDKSWPGKAFFLVKTPGVLAGIDIARRTFYKVDPGIRMDVLIRDGTPIKRGDVAGTVSGTFFNILMAERTAVNFMQHLSGVATETARLVEAVKGFPVQILDTRKTLPGLRALEKYAVQAGGGHNHRKNLGDGILIKDNHLEMLLSRGMSVKNVVDKVREKAPFRFKIEIEVTNPEEAREAAEAGADVILLDNMNVGVMREAVKLIKGRSLVEASGGITVANARAIAETGVNFMSSGSVTHSVKALDISLEFEKS